MSWMSSKWYNKHRTVTLSNGGELVDLPRLMKLEELSPQKFTSFNYTDNGTVWFHHHKCVFFITTLGSVFNLIMAPHIHPHQSGPLTLVSITILHLIVSSANVVIPVVSLSPKSPMVTGTVIGLLLWPSRVWRQENTKLYNFWPTAIEGFGTTLSIWGTQFSRVVLHPIWALLAIFLQHFFQIVWLVSSPTT